LSVKPFRVGPRAKLVSLKTYRNLREGQRNNGIVLSILAHLGPRVGQRRNYTSVPSVCLHVVLQEELHLYLALLISIDCTTYVFDIPSSNKQ